MIEYIVKVSSPWYGDVEYFMLASNPESALDWALDMYLEDFHIPPSQEHELVAEFI